MRELKILILILIFGISFIIACSGSENRTGPTRNFTRSRYSLRRSTTTTSTTVSSNSLWDVENSVDWSSSTEGVPISSTITLPTKINKSSRRRTTTKIPSTTVASNSREDTVSTVSTPNVTSICGEKIGENHPWIAVIVHTDPTGRKRKKTLSKGVLISDQHVLTTVSSVHNSHPFWIVSAVRLGDTQISGSVTSATNKSSIIKINVDEVIHHQFKDIAIIRLSEKVNLTDTIKPICLPEDDNYNFRELVLHMCKRIPSQFNRRHPRYEVMEIPVSPLSPQDCSIMFHRKNVEFSMETFCAWDQTGDDCTGDLGGPLVGKLNGRYQVIGLNSYVNSKEKFNAEDYPGVYTRVGSHLQWIKTVLNLKE